MEPITQQSIVIVSILLTAILGFVLKKINFNGAITGAVLAMIIFFGGGLESLIALLIFFALGSYASSWKKDIKKQFSLAQENEGKRGVANVLANGGTAGLLSIIALFATDYHHIINLMIIASFATACSDTLSSELGNIYGKRYFDIVTLKSSKRGLDGTISKQGLWFGVLGSLAVALSTFVFHKDYILIFILTVSGFLGNIIDSVLGATLQRKGYLNNHHVNFLATLTGSLFSLLFWYLVSG